MTWQCPSYILLMLKSPLGGRYESLAPMLWDFSDACERQPSNNQSTHTRKSRHLKARHKEGM